MKKQSEKKNQDIWMFHIPLRNKSQIFEEGT